MVTTPSTPRRARPIVDAVRAPGAPGRRPARLAAALLALAGCGDPAPDGADAAARGPDAAPGADAGACGSGAPVTGALLDLDSTSAAVAGIAGATLTQRGGTATGTTAADGGFALCVADGEYLFDVDAPGDLLDGVAFLEAETQSGPAYPVALRTMTAARAASFYAAHGLAWDAGLAHVLVFVAGDRSEVSLAGATHGAPLCGNDDAAPGVLAWGPCDAAGAVGRVVLFPGVDPTAGTVELRGDLSGPHALPVTAGQLTLAAVVWFFE